MQGLNPRPGHLGAVLGRHWALSDNLGGAQEGFWGLQEGPKRALNVLVLSNAQNEHSQYPPGAFLEPSCDAVGLSQTVL